ncbi:S1-like domain-containing RNA-binding protein [uncultured Tolumonas sp.]|uniref:CvfB family protein n=1 Tax=uncultured Tolumonas sp. TaxID=263765 RepID=UPI00292F57BF|nr:S1-like domain-containing RNA-binding protein [uncultured Tolumonas sp.]
MIQLGRMNSLPIIKLDEKGAWLDADDLGQVFVPQSQLPEAIKVGSTLAVFPYLDGDSELVISADKPLAQVGEFAGMKVISASRIGAFLDWGLKKDLFVPANEQAKPMQTGHTYVVYVYLDRESRPTATSRLDHYLSIEMPRYEPWEEVDLLICEQTDLGYKVIVNKKFWGLIFYNEIFTTIKIGQRTKGYIKKIHEDGKLDVTLNKPGLARKDEAGEKILARLQKQGGFLPVGDKSSPELIYSQFSMSKGTFKKAIGGLFKQGLIVIESDGIRLV